MERWSRYYYAGLLCFALLETETETETGDSLAERTIFSDFAVLLNCKPDPNWALNWPSFPFHAVGTHFRFAFRKSGKGRMTKRREHRNVSGAPLAFRCRATCTGGSFIRKQSSFLRLSPKLRDDDLGYGELAAKLHSWLPQNACGFSHVSSALAASPFVGHPWSEQLIFEGQPPAGRIHGGKWRNSWSTVGNSRGIKWRKLDSCTPVRILNFYALTRSIFFFGKPIKNY